MWLLIKYSLYDFYNIICISSMFMWLYIHLIIPVLMLPQHTGNISTGISTLDCILLLNFTLIRQKL